MTKKNIYDYSREKLEQLFVELGEKKFRATQIYEAAYRNNINDFEMITTLSKESRKSLAEIFEFSNFNTKDVKVSEDGTIKFLFELKDKNLIETVLMPHDYGDSVCVTTQVGCNMGCKFCASGTLKKIRNLTTGEIVMQVVNINKYLMKLNRRVSHVVIMGIGEPFDNFDNVMEFIRIINDPKGLEIGSRHITVSTCGIVPKIYEFSDFPLQVNLAISLHFPNNELREKYMLINKKYKLEELITALKYYYEKTNRRITFEYILLKDVNDSLDMAKELVELVSGMNCYINLIPYNETDGIFKRTTVEKRNEFFEYLIKNGMNAIVRKEYGHDIDAACGQLRAKKMMENK